MSSTLSTSALLILLIHLINSAQFLKTISSSFLSAEIAAASSPCPATVILPSTIIYASL